MKKYTISEVLSIILALPIVIIFLILWVVGCVLLYIAVAIRTGRTTTAILTLERYVEHGEIKFTWK